MNMVIGYILTILGCFETTFSFLTIANDRRYSYTAPFTSHERTIIAMLIISIIILIAGIFVIIFSIVKNKNESKLREITNQNQDKSEFSNKCPSCNLNVAKNCSICPRCGQKLE